VAAVTVNRAEIAPAGTCTEAGTARAEAILLEGSTVIPLAGAALDMVTAQVVTALGARLRLPHESDVIWIGAIRERFAVLLTPFKPAVTDAT
jgi:hypothetical protein